MNRQPELPFSGKDLATIGQALAIESADVAVEKWSDTAYSLLLDYIRLHGAGYTFQAEDARKFCHEKGLPLPPSNRAQGGLFRKLRNKGFIRSAGVQKVENPKAHSCYSTLWEII